VLQDYNYTTYDPVTTLRTDYVDQGGFQNSVVYTPGRERNRLQWLPGTYAVDPVTGASFWRRPGLYWVPSVGAGAYAVQQQYVPNVVAVQRPETTLVARVVTEKRPVQVTRYVDEVLVEKVPVKVCRMEQTEEVRQIPVTVQKPVVERINYKIPVKTCRWVEQEMVRKVPITTQRVVYEERTENVAVQVCKWVTENQTVREPRTIATWKPYEAQQCVPRTVVMRVPLDSYYSDLPSTTTYYYPAPSPSAPALPPSSSNGATILQRVPLETEAPERSVLTDDAKSRAEPSESAAGDKPATEPKDSEPKDSAAKDSDPTGTPMLRFEDLKLDSSLPQNEDTDRPKPEQAA
jgi:hypothetical protein